MCINVRGASLHEIPRIRFLMVWYGRRRECDRKPGHECSWQCPHCAGRQALPLLKNIKSPRNAVHDNQHPIPARDPKSLAYSFHEVAYQWRVPRPA